MIGNIKMSKSLVRFLVGVEDVSQTQMHEFTSTVVPERLQPTHPALKDVDTS
ncbi:hypothetical protein [Vibrio ostreicida]|uniref:hypothetical protein n=1 Tax=Vibrio ostreicida TaxID=526588 RepID=UPI0015C35D87|nr:hypothetical protein [Vibrio ostreicida]